MLKGFCVECNQAVEGFAPAIYEITGFEEERSEGGTNHVLDRQRVDGRVWHRPCFEDWRRKRDGRGQQASLSV